MENSERDGAAEEKISEGGGKDFVVPLDHSW